MERVKQCVHGNAGKLHAPGADGYTQGRKQVSPKMPRAPGGRMKLTARKSFAAPDMAGQKAQVKAVIAKPRAATPVRNAKGGAMEKMSKDSSKQNSKAVAVAGDSCLHIMRLDSCASHVIKFYPLPRLRLSMQQRQCTRGSCSALLTCVQLIGFVAVQDQAGREVRLCPERSRWWTIWIASSRNGERLDPLNGYAQAQTFTCYVHACVGLSPCALFVLSLSAALGFRKRLNGRDERCQSWHIT